jgi:hypothetical protein
MPQFYFDIQDRTAFHDVLGSNLPDLDAARIEAVRYSAEVLKEMPERYWNCDRWTMTVCDADHRALFTLKIVTEGPASLAR